MTERKRACQDMANEGTESIQPEVPHLGEAGYFCIELFCGSGNFFFFNRWLHRISRILAVLGYEGIKQATPVVLRPKRKSSAHSL